MANFVLIGPNMSEGLSIIGQSFTDRCGYRNLFQRMGVSFPIPKLASFLIYLNKTMSELISVVIPNYNGATTIGDCIRSVLSSTYRNIEIIVVDDCSEDNSLEKIKDLPCKIIRLDRHSGASRARNVGVQHSRGSIIFFTDSDCLLLPDTLGLVYEELKKYGPETIIGGTYTPIPHDRGFFSTFQSVFINYSETKKALSPDYIPTHAMAIYKKTFNRIGGFREDFLPIIEDVEFSHRARKEGIRLIISPDIMVRHIFHYNLIRSFRNAIRKSFYWSIYSLSNKDLLKDSGTASFELKFNVLSFLLVLLSVYGIIVFPCPAPVILLPLLPFSINLIVSRRLVASFYRSGGMAFALRAVLYYVFLYPLPVGTGSAVGVLCYPFFKERTTGLGRIGTASDNKPFELPKET